MTMAAPGSTPAIRLTDIDKYFGPVHANRDAALEVAPGEIHALVGENGAGKSTLMRVLSGMYAPDGGKMFVEGRDVTGWTTADAIDAGVGMVHQHFMLVPTLTVAENMILGRELTKAAQLDRHRAEHEVEELSRTTGLVVRPRQLVADLSVGEAQRVEILKTLYRGAKILILDEPTAVLSPPEIDELWTVLRGMRSRGETIVLITHKLDEVMEISDTITVMRHGRTVDRMRTADTNPGEIARAMVGRNVQLAMDYLADEHSKPGQRTVLPSSPSLEVRGLVVNNARRLTAVDNVSLSVFSGEILGIAGVEGNGQTELLEAIAGLRAIRAGSISIGGRDVTSLSVKHRGDAGLSHIPEDRHARGLSGGNQQKIVVAREMGRAFQVLLAAQPTRGVDVGAIEFIHTRLRDAREAGKAILLVSADLAEILALSDRIAVMYEGKIVATLPRADATEEVLGSYMTGAAGEAA